MEETTQATTSERKLRKVRVGTVVSDKMQKTVVVQIEHLVKHPTYRRYVRQRKRYQVHDEENQCHIGDVVSFMDTRPLSKAKRWRLVEIIERAK